MTGTTPRDFRTGRSVTHRQFFALATLAALAIGAAAPTQQAVPPAEIKVLPVFFVPKGEVGPNGARVEKLMRHLNWSRTRYREMLSGRDTYTIAQSKPHVYRADRPLSFYRSQPESGVPQQVSELLESLKFNRYTCPYVLLVVVMNPANDFPNGGGRPLNGGYNTGGGVIAMSSFALDRIPYFQSTLQHELGHGFGLPHVDVYGYDMKSNPSIMSYDPRHHTNGFSPSAVSGRLIPEDLRGLALNRRAFPKLEFDADKDVPQGYTIAERIVTLGPMVIPGQPDGIRVTTTSGEDYGSKVANIVQGQILPSKKTGKVTFDGKLMWSSAKTATGWATVDVSFPYEVELTGIGVHSQHSGQYHPARAVRVRVRANEGPFRDVANAELKSVDETVALPKTKGKTWQFDFQADETNCVVLRGLQFFSGDDELFPPLVPYRP
jgi:hypothetical protein